MKYYAVTEDPNELLHYGVKGMKWGQHIFGDKPKSAGYHRALGKLRGFAKKANSGIKKANIAIKKSAMQASINRQKKQEDNYAKAVEKAQRRINIVENMGNVNRMMDYEKRVKQDYKEEHKAEKAALKQERKFAKNEKHMGKYTQLAREGRLSYGKLSDDQIRQITDRLALERSARSLGNTEKPSYRLRRKEAIREGKLEGYKRGTSAAMEEVARGLVQMGFKNRENRKALDAKSRYQAERDLEASKIKNRKSHSDLRREFSNEVYKERMREGEIFGTKSDARALKKIEEKRSRENWELDQERKTLDSQRQDRLNADRAEEELRQRARLAYEYGTNNPSIAVPKLNENNGGNNGGNKGKNGKNGGNKLGSGMSNEELARYYKQRYIEGVTDQQKAEQEEKEKKKKERKEKQKKAVENINNKVIVSVTKMNNANASRRMNKQYGVSQAKARSEAMKTMNPNSAYTFFNFDQPVALPRKRKSTGNSLKG